MVWKFIILNLNHSVWRELLSSPTFYKVFNNLCSTPLSCPHFVPLSSRTIIATITITARHEKQLSSGKYPSTVIIFAPNCCAEWCCSKLYSGQPRRIFPGPRTFTVNCDFLLCKWKCPLRRRWKRDWKWKVSQFLSPLGEKWLSCHTAAPSALVSFVVRTLIFPRTIKSCAFVGSH